MGWPVTTAIAAWSWEMFEAVRRQYPGMAGMFRIEDVRVPVDLLKR